jgi:UDP-N-acetylglucosamine acyltransferase
MQHSSLLHHPTALISPEAHLGVNVRVGAFSIIERGAVIGDNTEIRSSATITNFARIGAGCTVYPHAIIGTEPQDLKFRGETTFVHIGDRTVIREFVTINRGTNARSINAHSINARSVNTHGETRIGNDCLLMAYCHVAHDCLLGNNVVIANATQMGGHVAIEDFAVLGGLVKIHQFCTIGAHAMVGAGTKVVKDIAPFTLVDGVPAKVGGINVVGLERRGFSAESVQELREFYEAVLWSGLNVGAGVEAFLRTRSSISKDVEYCIHFIEHSQRGICR